MTSVFVARCFRIRVLVYKIFERIFSKAHSKCISRAGRHTSVVENSRGVQIGNIRIALMAHLVTKHDPFHIHKILGTAVLLHLVYRLLLLFTKGTAFPATEPKWQASAGVILHGLLSWSSLLLPLPAKRNWASPMIWPEFRFHSITFATRHAIAPLLTINSAWPTNQWANTVAKLAVVLGGVQAASRITDRYGDREQRTTNAMPYPEGTTEQAKRGIKWQYAKAQFAATMLLFTEDATLNWFPLVPIQAAPFLMTLVRKGKVTSLSYHRIYAFTLWLSYVAFVIRLARVDSATRQHWYALAVASSIVAQLRMRWRIDQSVLWTAFALICLSRGVMPHFWGFDSEWSAACFIPHIIELALGYSPLCPSLTFVANAC